MNTTINWSKAKKSVQNIFGKAKKEQFPVHETKEITLPEIEDTKKQGQGRAFKNRKTTRARRPQYIPIYNDSMGNVHYKLIYHGI